MSYIIVVITYNRVSCTNDIVSAVASNSDYHLYQPFVTTGTIANLKSAFDLQETMEHQTPEDYCRIRFTTKRSTW